MIVKDIMHDVTKIYSNTTISEVTRIMDSKSLGSVLIEEDNKILGIMTERDILRKIVAKGQNPDEMKVNDIMTKDIITIDVHEDSLEASRIMDENGIRRLIVTENGKIVGKVTANSIARNLKYLLTKDRVVYTQPEY